MKKILTFIVLALTSLAISAQTLHVVMGSVTYSIPASQAGEMVYTDGTSLTILNKAFPLENLSRMYVDNTSVEDNTVTVNYDGTNAYVVVAGNIAQYITPTVNGAQVSIEQSEAVGETTCGEITYLLSGESSDGCFNMTGSYKSTVVLQGLSLTNLSGAAMDIQNGKRIKVDIKSGTVNSLVDGADGSQKGCIVCKGHIEFKGDGSLHVTGNKSHAIYAKEYIEMKNCKIQVLSSIKDGLNCNQYFLMESGELDVANVGDDGVQVSFKDDTDREAEDTGSITILSGTISVSATAKASKAIKADGDINISGGTFTLSTSGGGKWDDEDVKTKGASCLNSDGTIHITGGTFTMNSTGSAGKGISCDGDLTIDDCDLTITTTGGVFAYVNGTEYDGYTGNTDRLDSNYKSSPKGIKADGNITINGGNIAVKTTGMGGEGIESKSEMTINDGTILVNSYDDGLNSSSHMYVNGGDITVVATNNDGLDSNGHMYLNGGVVRAFGGSAPETGLDANDEEGYHVYITGGTILGVGGNSNSTPQSTTNRQYYLTVSGSPKAGDVISVKSGNNELASFTVPENYSGSSSSGGGNRPGGGGGGMWGGSNGNVLISCAGLTSGSSYTVTIGSSSSTATAK